MDSFRPRLRTASRPTRTLDPTSVPPDLKPFPALQPAPPFPALSTRPTSRSLSSRPPESPHRDPTKKRHRPTTPPPRPRPRPPTIKPDPDSDAPTLHPLRPPGFRLDRTPQRALQGGGDGDGEGGGKAMPVPISLASRAFKLPAAGGSPRRGPEEEARLVAGGARSLGAIRPKVPEGGRWDEGDAAEREWTEQLSPRKKKGGYLM